MSSTVVITEPLFIKKKTVVAKKLTKPVSSPTVVKQKKPKTTPKKKQVKESNSNIYAYIKPGYQSEIYSVCIKFKTPNMYWSEYWREYDIDRMYPRQCWYRYIKLRERQLKLTMSACKSFQMQSEISKLQNELENILDDRKYENAYYITQENLYKSDIDFEEEEDDQEYDEEYYEEDDDEDDYDIEYY